LKNAHPVPVPWRPIFVEIANAMSRPGASDLPRCVAPLSGTALARAKATIKAYGVNAVLVPPESWQSSCAQWMGDRWDVVVDLWAETGEPTDLLLAAQVRSEAYMWKFEMTRVYVP